MKRCIMACVIAALVLVFTSCDAPQPLTGKPALPKVAFVYVGPIGDMGWTYAHDVARLELEQVLGVETAYIENIVEGADAERVMRDFISKGYTIIFATADGYRTAVEAIAEDPTLGIAEAISAGRQPPVAIHCIEGASDIYEGYFGRMYRPRYLSGMIAGAATETNIIGYVAAHQIPQVIKGINGFTLGVRAMNPDAEVRVVWTNTWFDPPLEYEAAEALLDAGADVIAQHQDSTMPQEAAKARGVLGVGYDTDMAQYVGDTVLTSPVWDWGLYYTDRVQAFIDGDWLPKKYFSGDIVGLAPVSDRVPEEVFLIVQDVERLMDTGKWDVFCGPIYSNTGELMVAGGECLDDEAINSMSWYVDGVKE